MLTFKNTILKVSLAASLLVVAFVAQAQAPIDTVQTTYKGIILNKQDTMPLVGADVYFRGRATGVKTNDFGEFVIKGFKADTVLSFFFPGLIIEEVRVADSISRYEIWLKPLPEYVTEGLLSSVLKSENIKSLAKVDGQTLNRYQNTTFETALQGRVAGVEVRQSTGIHGAASKVNIRGVASIFADNTPLYIIDGMPLMTGTNGDGGGSIGNGYGFQTNPLSEINPLDIENLTVLKDAASTAAYGARGGNGVILIETKRGIPGKTKFTLDYFNGISTPTKTDIGLLNGNEYTSASLGAYRRTFGVDPTNQTYLTGNPALSFSPANEDYVSRALQSGSVQNLLFNASGGNKRVNFFFSANYRDEKGLIKGTDYNRVNLRFNAVNQASERLVLGLNSLLSFSNAKYGSSGLDTNGGFGTAQTRSLPIFPVFVPLRTDFNPFFNPYSSTNIEATQNPEYSNNTKQVFRNVASVFGEYKISKDFSWRSDFGVEYFTNTDRQFRSRYIRKAQVIYPNGDTLYEPFSAASDSRNLFFAINSQNALSFNKEVGKNKITFKLGNQYYRNLSSYNGAASERFPNDYSQQVSAGAIPFGSGLGNIDGFVFSSYFLTGNVVNSNKYVATATVRVDGSSRFGSEYGVSGYGIFPAMALGWLAHKETFLSSFSKLDELKLRVSAGKSGNASFDNFIKNGYWRGYEPYIDRASEVPGRTPSRLANNSLGAESIWQYDAGADFSWFKGRLSGTLDYYYKLNNAALLQYPVAPSNGLDNPLVVENGATIVNRGLELALSSQNFKSKDQGFNWITTLTLATLNNKVTDLGGLPNDFRPGYGVGNSQIAAEGEALGTFYLAKHAGIASEDDANGRWKKGDELIYDRNGNKFRPTSVAQIDSAAVLLSGKSALPKLYGGLSNVITYKGFDLEVFFTFSAGNYILDDGERRQSYITGETNLRKSAVEYGANLYYSGNNESFTNSSLDPLSQRNTDRFLHNASYIRLRNISFGYSLPEALAKKIKFNGVRIYVSAQNLMTFTSFKGWDPESYTNLSTAQMRNLGTGVQAFDLPQLKTIIGGLTLKF